VGSMSQDLTKEAVIELTLSTPSEIVGLTGTTK
jgi:hypothetical protein